MILFYNKKTGEIVGSIEGRVHTDAAHQMHIGDPEVNGKITVEWKLSKLYKNKRGEVVKRDFAPDHPQVNLFKALDENPNRIYQCRVDPSTLKIHPKEIKADATDG